MINTPNNYNPFPTIRHLGAKVEFKIIDTNAADDGTPSSPTSAAVSNLSQLTDGKTESQNYTSLEINNILLDGSYKAMPKSGADTGWWSSGISSPYYNFATPQKLRIDFNVDITSLGFTLYYQSAPREVKITTYNSSGTVIEEKTFYGRGKKQIYDMPIQAYRAVAFEFIASELPQRRIKLNEIVFGIVQTFDESSLMSINAVYGADIMAQSLPYKQLIFKFDNADHKYNLLNPDGIYTYLQDNQIITAEISIDGIPVDLGKFYFTRASSKDNALTAEIVANDIIYTLDLVAYDKGRNEIVSLSEAVNDVLSGFEVSVYYGKNIAQRQVSLDIPVSAKRREALRMLAQAAMCSVWVDRDGVLHFEQLNTSDNYSGELTESELYNYDGIIIEPKIDIVELNIKPNYSGADRNKYIYRAGDGVIVKAYNNSCVPPSRGAEVAQWLLQQYNRVKRYNVQNRCDPAVEIGDTINIADIYSQHGNAVVTGVEIKYNGGLSSIVKGVGK